MPAAAAAVCVWVDWRPGDAAPLSVTLRTRKDELNRLQRDRLDQELRNEEREELNLLYVAMTRAQRTLNITWAEQRTFGGKVVTRRRSPLLDPLAQGSDPSRGVDAPTRPASS